VTVAHPTRRSRRRAAGREPWWVRLPDDELLDLRLCDLKLSIRGTMLEQRINRLYRELAAKGIRYRPLCWLSSEWFSPDGYPGIAIPFYLAHPRLARLERRHMMEVEGGTEESCMKILRHEAGHAIDSAYRLHFKKRWRDVFGRYSEPYPDHYAPRPYSRSYVVHLDFWYAQAHPAEDWAETFAVWLTPRSRWRQAYDGWPAMRKLITVDELMHSEARRRPVVPGRDKIEPLDQLTKTLRRHYREKRLRYGEWPEFYDAELRRLFSDETKFTHRRSASEFLRQIGPLIRPLVARWTGVYQYVIDQVVQDMIDRCDELGLHMAMPAAQAQREATVMLTVQTMNYLHTGQHRIAL
jgi:hypothetical protein